MHTHTHAHTHIRYRPLCDLGDVRQVQVLGLQLLVAQATTQALLEDGVLGVKWVVDARHLQVVKYRWYEAQVVKYRWYEVQVT